MATRLSTFVGAAGLLVALERNGNLLLAAIQAREGDFHVLSLVQRGSQLVVEKKCCNRMSAVIAQLLLST